MIAGQEAATAVGRSRSRLPTARIELSRVKNLARELAEALDDPGRPREFEGLIEQAAGTAPPDDQREK